jgi:hypothetical protein
VTLRLKLFLLLAGITVFSTSGVTAVALWREVQRGQELLDREGAAMAAQVAATAARFMRPAGADAGAREALEPVLARLVEAAPLDRAWIVDGSGAVVACVAPPAEGCPPGAPSMFGPGEGPVQALTRLLRPEGIVTGAPVLRDGALTHALPGRTIRGKGYVAEKR